MLSPDFESTFPNKRAFTLEIRSCNVSGPVRFANFPIEALNFRAIGRSTTLLDALTAAFKELEATIKSNAQWPFSFVSNFCPGSGTISDVSLRGSTYLQTKVKSELPEALTPTGATDVRAFAAVARISF